jgi:dihydropteroate synthase-like protein
MKVLFVTGKLAAPLLRDTLQALPGELEREVAVLGISVAALMTTDWVARFLKVPPGVDLILLPGHAQGDLEILEQRFGVRAEKGPKDLRQIPRHFGMAAARSDYGPYDVQIVAEINNAPSLSRPEILARARDFAASGAEIIDVGCTKGRPFPDLVDVVKALRGEGHRVSIDSFEPAEVRAAVSAGADLVLSVNGSNLELAREVDATVVVIPDFGAGLETLYRSADTLEGWGVRFILDPVLEPIGFGFADSMQRYHQVRRRYPQAEILMGIANLTELTEADTTGMAALLLGYCQELGIRYVLTTQEIPWARGAVRETDIARRLMHYAVTKKSLPKHVDSRLVTARDPAPAVYTESELRQMQAQITDLDYRIFTDGERIHVFNAERFVSGTDVSEIFTQLDVEEPTHAFYLGKELMKASLALTLGKTYRQEGELSWGYLTPPEPEDAASTARRESRLRAARERADRRQAAARRQARRG